LICWSFHRRSAHWRAPLNSPASSVSRLWKVTLASRATINIHFRWVHQTLGG
jgi:hypothetical protein